MNTIHSILFTLAFKVQQGTTFQLFRFYRIQLEILKFKVISINRQRSTALENCDLLNKITEDLKEFLRQFEEDKPDDEESSGSK